MERIAVFDQHAQEYDGWFDQNQRVYQAELEAVRRALPATGLGD